MKQKNTALSALLVLALCSTGLHAQQSLNASGGNATGSGGSVSYSIGQVVYTQVSGGGGTANQGVQQPYEFFATGIDEAPGINLRIAAYPNPANAVLNLSVENLDPENLSYSLYDISGRLVHSSKVSSGLSEIAMQGLQTGTYILRISENEKQIKSFTIIKNQ